MIPRLIRSGILLASFLFTCVSHAGLVWTATTVEHILAEGESKTDVPFTFTIEGDKSVTISELTSSCDCTVATMEKRTYQPGESGTVVAQFTAGTRYGVQQKEIYVRTDEPGVRRQTLRLKVQLPELVTLDVRQLTWNRDVTPSVQTVAIKVADGVTLELRSLLVAQAAQIDVKLEGGAKGGEYQFSARPQSTANPQRIPVLICVKKNGKLVSPTAIILRIN